MHHLWNIHLVLTKTLLLMYLSLSSCLLAAQIVQGAEAGLEVRTGPVERFSLSTLISMSTSNMSCTVTHPSSLILTNEGLG